MDIKRRTKPNHKLYRKYKNLKYENKCLRNEISDLKNIINTKDNIIGELTYKEKYFVNEIINLLSLKTFSYNLNISKEEINNFLKDHPEIKECR